MAKNDSRRRLANFLAPRLEAEPAARMLTAKSMGVGDGTLGRIKYGEGNPTIDVLDRIADHYKVKTWQMLASGDEASQPARLTGQMLAESIAALRHIATRRGLLFDEVNDAETLASVIELRMGLPDVLSQADVIDFGERAREILESGGQRSGSKDRSGSSAAAGGDNRGQSVGKNEGAPRTSGRRRTGA